MSSLYFLFFIIRFPPPVPTALWIRVFFRLICISGVPVFGSAPTPFDSFFFSIYLFSLLNMSGTFSHSSTRVEVETENSNEKLNFFL